MKRSNRGLPGWEEKAGMVRLVTEVIAPPEVLFSKLDASLILRYRREGDQLIRTLRRVRDGKTKDEVFRLHLAK